MNPAPRPILFVFLPAMALATGCQTAAPARQVVLSHTFRESGLVVTATSSLAGLHEENLPIDKPTGFWKEFLLGPELPSTRQTLPRIPQGLIERNGYLYVCDPALPDIVEVNLATGGKKRWTSRTGRPACPVDVTFAESGLAYVADTTLRTVLVYQPDGTQVESLTPARADSAPGFRPAAVLCSGGILHVSDPGGHTVERYRIADRTWLPPFQSTGSPLLAPLGLARTPDGDLLVADGLAGVVHRFHMDGSSAKPLGMRGRGPGQFVRPMDVACTPDGLIWVADSARQSVQVFSANGDFILEVAAEGGWPGFTLPTALTVVPRSKAGETPEDRSLVVVSDALGTASLTVLEVGERHTAGKESAASGEEVKRP